MNRTRDQNQLARCPSFYPRYAAVHARQRDYSLFYCLGQDHGLCRAGLGRPRVLCHFVPRGFTMGRQGNKLIGAHLFGCVVGLFTCRPGTTIGNLSL